MLRPYALAFLVLFLTGATVAQQRCTGIQFDHSDL